MENKMKTGYKVLTKYDGKLYSFLLGRLLIENDTIKTNYFNEYSKEVITGNPWIAIFNNKNNMFNFMSELEVNNKTRNYSFVYYKVKYTHFKEKVIFMDFGDFRGVIKNFVGYNKKFQKNSLNKYFKQYKLLVEPPKGTIFAKEIQLIKEIPYENQI